MMKIAYIIVLAIIGASQSEAQPLATWSWQPSEHEKSMAFTLVEHYCRYRLSDQMREQQQAQETVVLKRYSIPEEFEVGKIKYSAYVRRCIPFLIRDFDGGERKFIAVQHVAPSDDVSNDFTLYFDAETGYVGFQLGEIAIGGNPPPYWQPRPSTNATRQQVLMTTNVSSWR